MLVKKNTSNSVIITFRVQKFVQAVDILFEYITPIGSGEEFFSEKKTYVIKGRNFFEIILHCLNNTAQSRGLLPSGALSRTR